ncbi:hypothetical protein Q8A73_014181 [Channa argus]|nr:hypothetical protein Q8A73_014181 [Channa argus]
MRTERREAPPPCKAQQKCESTFEREAFSAGGGHSRPPRSLLISTAFSADLSNVLLRACLHGNVSHAVQSLNSLNDQIANFMVTEPKSLEQEEHVFVPPEKETLQKSMTLMRHLLVDAQTAHCGAPSCGCSFFSKGPSGVYPAVKLGGDWLLSFATDPSSNS